jgi:hypothetical protein
MTIGSGGTGEINVNNSGRLNLCEPGTTCPGASNDYLFAQDYNRVNYVNSEMKSYGPNPVAWTFGYTTPSGPSSVKNIGGTGGNTVVQKPLYPISILVDKNGTFLEGPFASPCGTVSYYADSEGVPAGVESYSSSVTDSHLFRLGSRTQTWNESGSLSLSPPDPSVSQPYLSGRPVYYYNISIDPKIMYYIGYEGECWRKVCYTIPNNIEPTTENITTLNDVLNTYRQGGVNSGSGPVTLITFNVVKTDPPTYPFPSPSVVNYVYPITDLETDLEIFASQVPATVVDANCNKTINPTNPPVNNPLSCTVGVTGPNPPNPAKTGELVTWTVYPSGGSGGYTYSWSGGPGPDDGLSGTSYFVEKRYSSAGDKWGQATVKSNDGQTAICSNTVNILEPLTVRCFATPDPADIGDNVAWTAVPSGGTGEYFYTWSGDLGTGGTSGYKQNFYTTYDTGGTKNVRIDVKDSAENTNFAYCSLEVTGPQVSCQGILGTPGIPPSTTENPSPSMSQPVTWFSSISPPPASPNDYTYKWTGTEGIPPNDSPDDLTGTGPSTTKIYTTEGRKNAKIDITDASGSSVEAVCNVTVNFSPPPTSTLNVRAARPTCKARGAGAAEVYITPPTDSTPTKYKIDWKKSSESSYSNSITVNTSSLTPQGGELLYVVGTSTSPVDSLDPNFNYNFRASAGYSDGTWSSLSDSQTIKPSACDPEDIFLTCSGVSGYPTSATKCVAEYNGNVALTPKGISSAWSTFWDLCTPTSNPAHDGWNGASWRTAKTSVSQVGDNSEYQDFSANSGSLYSATELNQKEYIFTWACNKTKAERLVYSQPQPVNVCVEPPAVTITASPLNSSTIVVSWNRPIVEDSWGLIYEYRMIIDQVDQESPARVIKDQRLFDCVSVAGKCQFFDTGLTPGSVHSYQLQVLSSYDDQDPCYPIEFTTSSNNKVWQRLVGFGITASPSMELVAVGSAVGKDITSSPTTITASNFTDSVSLSVLDVKVKGSDGGYSSVNKSIFNFIFSQNPITSSQSPTSILKVKSQNSASPIPVGVYNITIQGQSGPDTAIATVQLKVREITPTYKEF